MEVDNQKPPQNQVVALPANRAFVVQFEGAPSGQEVPLAGRVEHVTSGHRARFASWKELQRFVEQQLAQLKTTAADPTSEELEEI